MLGSSEFIFISSIFSKDQLSDAHDSTGLGDADKNPDLMTDTSSYSPHSVLDALRIWWPIFIAWAPLSC